MSFRTKSDASLRLGVQISVLEGAKCRRKRHYEKRADRGPPESRARPALCAEYSVSQLGFHMLCKQVRRFSKGAGSAHHSYLVSYFTHLESESILHHADSYCRNSRLEL